MLGSLVALASLPLFSPGCVNAQTPATESSTALSFRNTFPVAQGTQGLASYSGTGVNLQYSASLTYGEDLVLTTESSAKYAQNGAGATLTTSESNDIVLVQLSGSAAITFSLLGVTTGSVNYPIDVTYAIPVTAGSYQSVTMGTFSVANAQVGPANVQVNMQPVISWTPIISGSYSIQGPASISPPSMTLSGSPANAVVSFTDSQPTDIFLENPQLTLEGLSLSLVFPVIISGLQVAAPSVSVVNAGNYFASASAVDLISFDPNYYTLYNQLESSLAGLTTTVQLLQNSYNTLSSTVQQLQTSFSSLNSNFQQLQTTVNGISSQFSSFSNDLNSLSKDVSNLTSSYLGLKSSVSSLTSGQTQLQQSLGSVSSSLSRALSQLASLASPQAGSGQTSQPFAQQFLQYTLYFVLGMGIGAGVTIAVVTLYRKVR